MFLKGLKYEIFQKSIKKKPLIIKITLVWVYNLSF